MMTLIERLRWGGVGETAKAPTALMLEAADAIEKAEAVLAGARERGRRDMLNAILELNPAVAAKVARFAGREPDPEGRLPFDVVLWVTEVATQLGIEPSDDEISPSSPSPERGEGEQA